jgi:hypothetical protein
VGFLFSSHVLEHMLDPRRFLRFARATLAPGGHFYVEVPDHTVTQPRNVPGAPEYIPLVVPEHIQYFSMRSLTLLAESSGFEVVKAERTQMYDGFLPRLKVLLRHAAPPEVGAVVAYCIDRNDGSWPAIGAQVAATIAAGNPVALWGCGFGLLHILGGDPRIERMIADGAVAVFDNQHGGKTLLGTTIRDQGELVDFHGTIVLTPALPAARTAMRAIATEWGLPDDRIVDPYPR